MSRKYKTDTKCVTQMNNINRGDKIKNNTIIVIEITYSISDQNLSHNY